MLIIIVVYVNYWLFYHGHVIDPVVFKSSLAVVYWTNSACSRGDYVLIGTDAVLNSARAIARALFHSRSPYQGIVPEGHALLVLLYRKKVTLNETSAYINQEIVSWFRGILFVTIVMIRWGASNRWRLFYKHRGLCINNTQFPRII